MLIAQRVRTLGLATCGHLFPLTAITFAQWTPIRLQGPADSASSVACVFEDQQGGWRQTKAGYPPGGPGIWSSSAASWQPLSGGENGRVHAIWGGLQGGSYSPPGGGIWASLWSGTPQSQVFLHPGGVYRASEVLGLRETEQVGVVVQGLQRSAAVWHGTAGSFVNLHPTNAVDSEAVSTNGIHQYGWVRYPNDYKAVMWSGSAASMLSLDPELPNSITQIFAGAPGLQAGIFEQAGSARHAAIWRGNAATFRDIHPVGYFISEARGACESAVVGSVNVDGVNWHAGIWIAPSFDFLELPVPAGYSQTYATSVAFYNGRYYVGGYAQASVGAPQEAFVWIGVPAPAPWVAILGLVGIAAARRRGP